MTAGTEKWFLAAVSGPVQGKEFLLMDQGEIRIGRTDDNDIPVPEKNVSRHHVTLLFRDGSWWVRDEGSKNGSFLNDIRVTESQLQEGDVLRIGETRFRVGVERPGEAKVDIPMPHLSGRPAEWLQQIQDRLRPLGARRTILYLVVVVALIGMAVLSLVPKKRAPAPAEQKSRYTLPKAELPDVSASPEDILAWRSLADRALQVDDYRGAIPILRKLASARPNDEVTRVQLQRAEAQLAELIMTFYESGAREYEKAAYDRAIREWRKVLALSEGFDTELFRKTRAKILEAQGKLKTP